MIQRWFRRRLSDQLLERLGRGQWDDGLAMLNCSIEGASTQSDQSISAAVHRTYTPATDDKDPELGQCTTPSPQSSGRVMSRLPLTRLLVRTLPHVAITVDSLNSHHLGNGLSWLRRRANDVYLSKSPSSAPSNLPPKSVPNTTSDFSSC